MNLYTEHISNAGLESLKNLADSRIQSLLSSHSEWRINGHYFLVPEVSIRLGPKRFLIINNEWKDTPKDFINYYKLEASIADRPQRIKVEPYRDCWSYHLDHMTFALGRKQGIKSVSVLEDQYTENRESVRYDSAIHIVLEHENQVLISPDQSISGLLTITTDLTEIEADISTLKTRWSSN